jgi:hypothetical protein
MLYLIVLKRCALESSISQVVVWSNAPGVCHWRKLQRTIWGAIETHFERTSMRNGSTAPAIPATPLQGVRIVEMGQLIAGPFAGKTLGDFGADVIKIEAPDGGDPLRNWRMMKDGTSVWWQVQSRNKRSVALDLRSSEGQDIVRRLIAEADVLIENFRKRSRDGGSVSAAKVVQVRAQSRSGTAYGGGRLSH